MKVLSESSSYFITFLGCVLHYCNNTYALLSLWCVIFLHYCYSQAKINCQPLVPGILNTIFLDDKGHDINSFIFVACFIILRFLCISGQVMIEFRVYKETNFIVFHSKNLTITEKVSNDSCTFITGSYSKVVRLILSCMCGSVHK